MVAWLSQLAASKAADLSILWALGTQKCPQCADCSVTCPAVSCATPSINITCPTFTCPSAPRAGSGLSWTAGVVGFFTGVSLAFVLLCGLACARRIVSTIPAYGQKDTDEEATRVLALKQLAVVRQRHGGPR